MKSAIYNRVDSITQSNYDSIKTTHLHLNWSLDFATSSIKAVATHSMEVLQSGTTTIDFDTSKLLLTGDVMINDAVNTTVVQHDPVPILGQKWSVAIPDDLQAKGSKFTVSFPYRITSDAAALQWLSPSATKGGQYPYLFSQSGSKSMFPCMETPSMKITYTASVTAPSWCTVLMSALSTGSSTNNITNDYVNISNTNNSDNTTTFHFNQPVPIPAYLIALAAGHLASREISPRVRIWSEPEVVDDAHFEFSETEVFLTTAEELTQCPYLWTRYDVLCLPPSFPIGGMENPCLTFATPTLLAGDRSLASVIAHEIAHSWMGNLVTNHTFDHFWLNEGWTVWLERKIVSRVAGNPDVGKLSAQLNWKALCDDVTRMGGSEGRFTSLIWPLKKGDDPDEAFSTVPYEKGYAFLNYLEGLVGETIFLEFVAQYMQRFKFGMVTSGDFRDLFVEVVTRHRNSSSDDVITTSTGNVSIEEISALSWWEGHLLSPGMPRHPWPDFSNALSRAAEQLAARWIAKAGELRRGSDGGDGVVSLEDVSAKDIEGWVSGQKTLFLDLLILHSNSEEGEAAELAAEDLLPPALLSALDGVYSFSQSGNSEVRFRWCSLCLNCECEWILPLTVDFITSQGRMKFVRPLYRALRDSTVGANLARETFSKHKQVYHPLARKMVAQDLHMSE